MHNQNTILKNQNTLMLAFNFQSMESSSTLETSLYTEFERSDLLKLKCWKFASHDVWCCVAIEIFFIAEEILL